MDRRAARYRAARGTRSLDARQSGGERDVPGSHSARSQAGDAMRRRRTNRESGVVLIAVLWGMVVLSAMAFALATLVRSSSEELRARKEQLQAHYMARGAVYKAVVAIGSTASKPEEALFRPGQRELRWPESNGEVRVEVNDESGKLDLNAAPEATLQRLLINLGLDFQSAHDMVAAIEDWRAPAAEPRLGGAGA